MRKSGVFIIALLFSAAAKADGWLAFMSITDDYIGNKAGDPNIVLVLDSTFNSCGWNQAVDIRESVVGTDTYKTVEAAALAAIMSGKEVSVYVSGCIDDRAKGIAIRIQP